MRGMRKKGEAIKNEQYCIGNRRREMGLGCRGELIRCSGFYFNGSGEK